ncbi:MAG: AraC family transcriptional regulator [Woeseiaceae bacterium]
MSWNHDNLAPVETLLFRSKLVKVGYFACAVDHPCFAISESLDNDVFVLPKKPVWIRRNTGNYRFVEPGAILMHRAGSTIERRRATDFGDRTYWFGVHPDVFVDSLLRHGLSVHEMGGALIAEPQFRYRLVLFLKQLEANRVDRLTVEEEVLTLFFEICKRRSDQGRKSSGTRSGTALRQCRLVDTARAYLDAHLAESVGLDTVARAAGTSLYHLCRVFREQTGITMHEYRTRQRLGQALDRLLDGDTAGLTELALDLGFSSHSHLSRVFQKNMGVTPSSIRSSISQG